jgi:hypothetical protein
LRTDDPNTVAGCVLPVRAPNRHTASTNTALRTKGRVGQVLTAGRYRWRSHHPAAVQVRITTQLVVAAHAPCPCSHRWVRVWLQPTLAQTPGSMDAPLTTVGSPVGPGGW